MTCQKICSVFGGNLVEQFFSSRRREGISFFIMPPSLFAWFSPILGGISCKVKPQEQGMTEIRTPQAFCVG